MRVVVAGGGTAGHVFPAIAFARCLVEDHGAVVEFVGTGAGQESMLVPRAGFTFHRVEAAPFLRHLSPAVFRAPFTAWRSVRQALPVVAGADAVVGMGGYASVPAVLAARRTGRPIVLHEQNTVPGLANRLFARLARVVALGFPEAKRSMPRRARTVVTGNPVREDIARVGENRETLAKEALREFDLEEGRRTVLVFGGSQGALHLNEATAGALRILRGRRDLQVLLLTGRVHHGTTDPELPKGEEPLIRSLPFVERMDLAYALADLAISRAGASAIAELTACGVPSILVPYPYATGRHQELNARAIQRAGGATVLLDADVTPETLAEHVTALIEDDSRLGSMAAAAGAWGRPDAAAAMAGLVASVAEGLR